MLDLSRCPFHPIKDTPQLLQRNQSMIPQHYRQLSHRRLLLATDEREGGFGKSQVLLEIVDELGAVHELGWNDVALEGARIVSRFGQFGIGLGDHTPLSPLPWVIRSHIGT
jgi:hypothetical protein